MIKFTFAFASLSETTPRPMSSGQLLVTLVYLLWSGAIVIGAVDTHYVSLDGTNDSGNGYITWSGAATQIQWAVTAAAASDTVLVSNGTYNLTGQITVATAITLKSLYGTNDAALLSIINGNNYNGKLITNRCLYINNTAATVDGFVITNGYYITTGDWDGGGGVYTYYQGTLRNCIIMGNTVTNGASWSVNGGGGIYMAGVGGGCAFVVEYCDIVSNTALSSRGGGLYNCYGGTTRGCTVRGNVAQIAGGIYTLGQLLLSNCVVYGNQSGSGGGMYLQGGVTKNMVISNNLSTGSGGGAVTFCPLFDSEIVNNTASGNGGGVYMDYGGTVSNCTIRGNVATGAGGGVDMYSQNGFNIVDRCIVTANKSTTQGGGVYGYKDGYLKNSLIYCNTNLGAQGGGLYVNSMGARNLLSTGTGAVYNCTVVSNECGTLGGGAYVTGTTNYIKNCIIYGNISTNDAYDEVYNANSYNSNNYYNCCAPTNLAANQGNITNDPLFLDLANRNYHLSANSPCINRGSNVDWMINGIDLDGRTRIRYGAVDMGAYELIQSGTIYGFH